MKIYKYKYQYDWKAIQQFYDEGHTWREITEKFGVTQPSILRATRIGKFQSTRGKTEARQLSHKNGRSPKMPIEVRKRISVGRIKYLMEHPDQVPYKINHSSKKSWPEQVFENALISSNITGWKYAYQNGIYEYDFAFPEKKIDVEIDGGTHKSEKVKRIDERRDQFSKTQGWKVIRFEADRVKKDIVGCINELKTILV